MSEERIELEPESEVPCWIDDVKSGGKVVGHAPTKITDDVDDDIKTYGRDRCHTLIISQVRTNHKNTVRAKMAGGKLKASEVINLVVAGELDANKIKTYADSHNVDFSTAANEMMVKESDPEKIHWDVL